MKVVLDIETDAIDASVIHCIAAKDVVTGQRYEWKEEEVYADFPSFSKNITTYIMHNGISFDAPVLTKLLGIPIPLESIEDTLILSQLINPVRDGGHSLEAWGETLGYNKLPFSDFSQYSEEMMVYCRRDVEVTHRVYIYLQKEIEKIDRRSIDLEYRIRKIINEQEDHGFTLDVPKAMALIARLKDKSMDIESQVKNSFSPLPVARREVTPKYKKDGTLSTVGLRHLDGNLDILAGPHTIIEYPEFNLASRQQIVRQLMLRGWKPNKFTEKGHAIVDESVLSTVDIPEAKQIAEYLLLEKRITQVQSWLDAVDEKDRVHGRVLTLRTISGRMAHTSPNMAQVPAGYSPYGKECRECWTVSSPANVLVGCDASSLELRCLAHYLNDDRFTREVVEGDIHTANQKAAGLATRDQAKTFIYAFIYGAGAAKIGSIVEGTAKDGQRLIDNFLSNVPALLDLRKRVDIAAKRGYLIGLDGRRLIVRSEHAALNLLLQGAGAVICKQWLVNIRDLVKEHKLDAALVASIHDEYQHEVLRKHAEQFGELTKLAMKQTEKDLKVRCPLDSEFKIGQNWSQTH